MLLETRDLYIGYQQGLPLLKGVNLIISEASMIALLGSNGSGKTSLTRTLTGLIPPLRGSIKRDSKSSISLVPQMKNLKLEFPMTIKDSLVLSMTSGIGFKRKWNPTSKDWDVIERTGVGEFWNLLLRECSGGQLQRFLIARSLLSKANLVFLDEPLDALDNNSQKFIIALLKDTQKKRGVSFFIITHNLGEAWKPNFSHIFRIENQLLLPDGKTSFQENAHDQ